MIKSRTFNQVKPDTSVILQNISRSIHLSDDEKDLFISLLNKKTYLKKEDILIPGGVCTHQNYVLSGCVKVYYPDAEGNEHIVKFAIEDWWAFDIGSFFHATPAFYGIRCLEETTVLQLTHDAHQRILDKIPAFEKFYRLMLQNSFIALQNRMAGNLAVTARQRYENFQQKYPGLEKRISQKNIASYLGITPVFLSMIRKEYLVKH
jgi:CRP-like cAMP-binding protein